MAGDHADDIALVQHPNHRQAEQQPAQQPALDPACALAPARVPISHHQAKHRQHRRRNPIWQNARVQRVGQVSKEHRPTEAKEVQPEGVVVAAFPECRHGPQCPDKEYWVQERRLREQEIPKEPQRRFPGRSDAGVVGHMPNRGPAVLRIPEEHGEGAEPENQQGNVRAGLPELDPRRPPQQEKERPAKDEVQRAVLAEKTQACCRAGQGPLFRRAARLDGAPSGQHRQRPTEHQWRVDGHQDGADAEQRRGSDD